MKNIGNISPMIGNLAKHCLSRKDLTQDVYKNLLGVVNAIETGVHFSLPDDCPDKTHDVVGEMPFDSTLIQVNLEWGQFLIIVEKYIDESFIKRYYVHVACNEKRGEFKGPSLFSYIFLYDKNITDDVKYQNIGGSKDEENKNLVWCKTWATHYIRVFLNMLECNNVETKVVGGVKDSVNRKRIKRGKLPIYETRVLTIKGSTTVNKCGNGGSSHQSPRVHLRRGHIRRLANDVTTWVRPSVVGDKTKGMIDKTYRVER